MRYRYLDGLALGLLLGYLLSTLTLWLLDSTQNTVESFIHVHLTQFFTLFAAGLALWGVSHQIRHNTDIAERNRVAKLDAARSSLPIVLSNIHQICEARYGAIARGNKAGSEAQRWAISDFELSTLQACIEHAEGLEKYLMQQIIRVYQVLIARWDTTEMVDLFAAPAVAHKDFQFINRLEQFHAIMNWVTLRAISDSLFDYARGEHSVPHRKGIKDSIFFTLQHIGSGSIVEGDGWLLTNNENFSDFVDRQIEKNHVPFIDDDWK